MRKATTVTALAGLLALLLVPVSGAAAPWDQGQAVQAATSNDGAQAKPATDEKKAGAAQGTVKKDPDAQQPPSTAKPATAKPNPNALTKNQYGGGFRFTSDDGRFSIRFMGAAQFRYTYMKYDDNVNGNSEDYSNFFMLRARLWFDGHAYDPRFTYAFHLQLEPQGAVNLHDAWINYAFKPMFQIGAGRNKIAYGLEFVNSGFGNNFIDRSIFSGETDISSGGGNSRWPGGGTETFNVATEDANTGYPTAGLILFRSQGVQLSGKSGEKGAVFEYQLGLWQGRDTRGSSNPDAGHLLSARAAFYPNGAINWLFAGDTNNTQTFQTGFIASAYTDTSSKKTNYAGTAVPIYDTNDTGFDLAFMARYRGFSADIEWATETFEIEDTTITTEKEFDRSGWRAQFGYFLKPKVVEVVGRYAEMERLKDPTYFGSRNSGLGFARIRNGAVFTDAVEKKLTELTFGLNYYLSGAAHQHKVFVDYSRMGRTFAGFVSGTTLAGSVPDQKDDRVRAMLQLKF